MMETIPVLFESQEYREVFKFNLAFVILQETFTSCPQTSDIGK